MAPLPRLSALQPVLVEPVQPTATVRLPVLKIDAISVTRDLPASVTAPGAPAITPQGLARPSVNVPGVDFDYPVVDAPTQEEFDAAVNANNRNTKKEQGDEAAKARELSNKIPTPPILQQLYRPLPQLQINSAGLGLTATPTPAGPTAAQTAQPTGANVNLPFLGSMPLPSKESVALATTTAVAATFVAVLGKAVFEASLEGLRPALRLLLIRYKKFRSKDLNDEERQLEFAFDLQRKRRGKRTLGQGLTDLRDYFRDNFLEDLIGN